MTRHVPRALATLALLALWGTANLIGNEVGTMELGRNAGLQLASSDAAYYALRETVDTTINTGRASA